ncbi:MAG: glycosyltransferase 87 family protein [Lysobacterales bacterium]
MRRRWIRADLRYGLLLFSFVGMFSSTLFAYYLSDLFHAPVDTGFVFRKSQIGTLTIAQFSVMAACMLAAWYSFFHISKSTTLIAVAVVGVLCRILLLGADQYTSNDVDRYLFDGRMVVLGLDPYVANHEHADLKEEVAAWRPPLEHRKYPTLYPPLALAMFSACAAAGIDHAKWVWKGLLLSAGLMTLLLGFLTLKQIGALQHFPLLAFSPLLILETGVGLHLDALSTLAIALAVYAWVRHRWQLASVALGLGALIKIIPVVCLLPLVLVQRNLRSAVAALLPGVMVIGGGYGMALAMGFKPMGSLGVFFEKWRSGSPLFLFLDSHFSAWQSASICLGLALAGFLAISIGLVLQRRRLGAGLAIMPAFAMQAALAIPLILSPVIFPWYAMPLLPLLAVAPNIAVLSWIIVLPSLYEVLNQFVCCGNWSPALWPVHLIAMSYLIGALLVGRYWLGGRSAATALSAGHRWE